MPWTEKQRHLFSAVAHGWQPPASSGIHISQADAEKMHHEDVGKSYSAKPGDEGRKAYGRQRIASALRGR